MVRVVYRWQVAPQDFEKFHKTWRATTNRIHASVIGARGSFLLRSFDDETNVITVAKWDSLAAWKEFWGNANPQEMAAMRALGERVSVECFKEIEDHSR